jgi:hypothetical protein
MPRTVVLPERDRAGLFHIPEPVRITDLVTGIDSEGHQMGIQSGPPVVLRGTTGSGISQINAHRYLNKIDTADKICVANREVE